MDLFDQTSEAGIQIEYDDNSLRSEILGTINTIIIRFDDKWFVKNLLGFTPQWAYTPNIDYVSQKVRNLTTIHKTHLKCDCFDGRVVNALRQPKAFSFLLEKPTRYRVFCEPQTIHCKIKKKSVLKSLTFYLGEDDHKVKKINGETFIRNLNY